LLDPRGGHEYKVDDVVNALRAVIGGLCPHVEGLTVLGGEPFEQPEAVARVITPLREAGLSTMVYSGHTLTRLRATDDPHIQKLLSVVDLLVDGPFLPDLYSETLAWRGSTNQRIQCLTSRYTPAMLERAFAEQGKGFSIQVAPHRISVSGLQSRPAAEVVERMLGIDHS
jgi:anaerobic ribonucleoside-triphosphate reductase activating protein